MKREVRPMSREAAARADRARAELIRYMDIQNRVGDVMLQVGRAVGPAMTERSPLGPGYLAGETSLITNDFGFWATPVMLWWKTILWANDPAWIYRAPHQRTSARWSLLPRNVAELPTITRDAIRGAIHLMLLDGVMLHLIPLENIANDELQLVEVGMAPQHALAESPDLHSPKPILRVSRASGELRNRVALLVAMRESSGALSLCYTSELLSTELPKGWPRDLKNLLRLLQGDICPDCREPLSKGKVHVDHVRPRLNGGTSTLINLMLLHSGCNLQKGAHETGWVPTARVFHGFGAPVNFQQELLVQLFDPALTAEKLSQICRSSVSVMRRTRVLS